MTLINLIKQECTLGDEFGTSLVFSREIMELDIKHKKERIGFFSLYSTGDLEEGVQKIIELILKKYPELEDLEWLDVFLRYGLSLDFAGIPHSTMVYLDGRYIVEENFEKVEDFESLPEALRRFKAGHKRWFDSPIPS